MDWGEFLQRFMFIIVMVLLLAFNIFLRARRGQKTPLGAVALLLSEVNYNERLLATFSYHRQSNRFKAGSWKGNKDKLGFLPQELITTLTNTFRMVGDINEKIDAARKYKSDSYMASIDLRKLPPLLEKSRQGLEQWLGANKQNPDYYPKRRGLFG